MADNSYGYDDWGMGGGNFLPGDQPQQTSSGDPNASRRQAVSGFYRDILGREGDQAGIDNWTNSGLDLDSVKNAFYNSDEYKARGVNSPSGGGTQQSNSPQFGNWGEAAQWYQANHGVGTGLAGLSDFLNKQGYQNSIATRGTGNPSDDKLNIGGGTWDFIFDVGGPGQKWQMLDDNAPGGGGPGGGGSFGGGFGGGNFGIGGVSAPSVSATTGSLYTAPQRDPRFDDLYSALLKRSQQGLTVDPNDPVIQQQSDAFGAQANRQRLADMQAAAERGGPYATGLLGNIARSTSENVAQARGAFTASLLGKEVDARRAEIQNALSQMGNMLTADQLNALHVADSQLAARKAELDNQQNQFQDQLAAEQQRQNAEQQAWQRTFSEKNFGANLAQQNWQNDWDMYRFGAGA